MMNSKVLLVDKKDKFIGHSFLEEAHIGRGKRHRAFVTLLFDGKDQVLLQRRKHKLFDGLWDLTAVSHPLRIKDRDETYQQASDRALKKEMGIGHVDVKKIGAFNYFARDGKNCENEYCAVLTGQFSGDFKPNKREIYEAKWVKYPEFMADIVKNPAKFTPWAKETAKVLVNGKSLMVDYSVQSVFKEELESFTKQFSNFSKQFFSEKQKLVKKYPLLIARFYRELEDFGKGGKAMRPFLVYLGCKAVIATGHPELDSGSKKKRSFVNTQDDRREGFQNDIARILPVCLALELVHNFLLIHDDIIDNSDLRRGKPTLHKKLGRKNGHYGISQAIVIADIAAFEAIKVLNEADFGRDVKSHALDFLTNVILETAYGEALDIEYSYAKANVDKIWQVTELKTARYSFVGPFKIGALLAGGTESQAKALEYYGLKLGKAFQIQDDILGVFGDEKILGKSTLSDMREGKNTLLFYKAREKAVLSQKRFLDSAWGNPKASAKDLEKIKAIMQKSGALEWCQKQMNILIADAKGSISAISKDKTMQGIFSECADFVVYREK